MSNSREEQLDAPLPLLTEDQSDQQDQGWRKKEQARKKEHSGSLTHGVSFQGTR